MFCVDFPKIVDFGFWVVKLNEGSESWEKRRKEINKEKLVVELNGKINMDE